ncbi:hypothetical protein ES703_74952 [subsurface metagenome]
MASSMAPSGLAAYSRALITSATRNGVASSTTPDTFTPHSDLASRDEASVAPLPSTIAASAVSVRNGS